MAWELPASICLGGSTAALREMLGTKMFSVETFVNGRQEHSPRKRLHSTVFHMRLGHGSAGGSLQWQLLLHSDSGYLLEGI